MNIKVISGSQFPKEVMPLIDSAKQSIDIVVYDWRWYTDDPGAPCQLFNQCIARAIRRKVNVRAIVNNDFIINTLKSLGAQSKRLITSKLVHCKLMIIDDKIVITGSHNYSQAAFQKNFELSVIIFDSPDIGPVINFYNNLWSR